MDIKPHDAHEGNDIMGTNLNDNTWVPFNDEEPKPETRVPQRPETSGNPIPIEENIHMEPQYIQHPYMDMMQPPPIQEQTIMSSIQQTPIVTLAVVFGVGLMLGVVFSNRRPIILNSSH